jgi:pimeloyl-ACP methyl ester carboxylesterase
MDLRIGRFPAQVERPEPIKFAWPIVLLPELFTTVGHLAILLGYLGSMGWETYAPNLRSAVGQGLTPPLGRLRFSDLIALVEEALGAIGRDAIVLGHGIGGLLALKMAERPGVKAGVAFAPSIPGFRSPLFMRARNLPALWLGGLLKPPSGRALFDFVVDAEPYARAKLITNLVPDASAAAREVARGEVQLAPGDRAAPRLIVAGDSDPFAPLPRLTEFATAIGAQLKTLAGRGHWIIGGRALERAINEAHRFLVRSLGEDLLLLFPEEWKTRPDESG